MEHPQGGQSVTPKVAVDRAPSGTEYARLEWRTFPDSEAFCLNFTFTSHTVINCFQMSPSKPLYHSIHSQLLLFTSLHTLAISNIALCEHTYRVLELIPTLRTLKVLNSEYHNAVEQFSTDRRRCVGHPPVLVSAFPITHLHLHDV